MWLGVRGVWFLVCCLWSMASGLWCVVCGFWSMVRGQWSVVFGLWSVVGGTQVFRLIRRRSYNLFRRPFGNILAFFCVTVWNVGRSTHENAAATSSQGGRQTVFLAMALITSGKVVCGLWLVVCGWWSVVCGTGRWAVVRGLWLWVYC